MSAPRAAVAGLGNMGRGIAANLAGAGLLATAWDPAPGAVAAAGLPDAVAAASPDALAAADTVLFAVPGSDEIAALAAGPGGLFARARRGTVFVDLTTSAPERSHALAAAARAAGHGYLDAGMTGGASGAAKGRLTLMIGGDSETLARARPVLDAVAAQLFHVGPEGAGHSMKLVHNMICHTIFLATAEGCRAAQKAGIALEDAVAVLNAGNARSFVSERRFPDHIVSQSYDGRSSVSNLAKDLAMAETHFAELGQPAAYVALTAELLRRACDEGDPQADFTRLYPAYDALAARPPEGA